MGKVGRKPEGRAAQAPRPAFRDGPVLDLGGYVPGLLTFLADRLSRGASALYRRHFGIGITGWRVLSTLAVEPWTPASRVRQVIGLDKAPVSRNPAFLEKRGLVETRADGQDARRRLAALTQAGRAPHDRVIAVALERERRLLSCLSPAQRAELVALLNLLHDSMDAVNRPLAVPPAKPSAPSKG